MKRTVAIYGGALLLLANVFNAGAGTIAGPITNPANGHDYYLLTPNTWTASETEAENLGGTLAVINDADEQKWVFSTFGSYGDTNRNLWIGLHRGGPQRSFVWVASGETPEYVNWGGGQPDDSGGVEGFVFMASGSRPWGLPTGAWADYTDSLAAGDLLYGVVEVPGKSNAKSLTEKEKALIGTWYESGNADRPAWIVSTENWLFLITHHRHAARLVLTPEGHIFNADRIHGEIVKDKILWSNGTWWSRKPAEYRNEKASSDDRR